MSRDALLRLVDAATRSALVPLPWRETNGALVPPTPGEWAACIMDHALALGRALDRELARHEQERAHEAVRHLPECQPDTCAAGCPDVVMTAVLRAPLDDEPETEQERAAAVEEAQHRLDAAREALRGYLDHDRECSPPVRLLREEAEASRELREARAACDRATNERTNIEDRLVAGWRASGLPLGKLLIDALNAYAVAGATGLYGIPDVALVEMIEHYVGDLVGAT